MMSHWKQGGRPSQSGDARRKTEETPVADDAHARKKLRSTEWFGKADREEWIKKFDLEGLSKLGK